MSFDLRIKDGDLVIKNGDLDKVESNEKLVQDLLKIVFTRAGSNRYYPWYGSLIHNALIGTAFDDEFTMSMATSYLSNSIEILQQLQQEQSKFQKVSPGELIAAIQNIKIERNQIDPRFFSIVIRVFTRALTTASATFDVTPTL